MVLDKMGQDTQGTRPVLVERLQACLREKGLPDDKVVFKGTEGSREQGRCMQSDFKGYPESVYDIEADRVDCDHESCSSATLSIVSERVRLAGLKARAACLNKKHELNRQAQDIRAMQETMELEMQIREAAAREAVLKNEDSENRNHGSPAPAMGASTGAASCSDFENVLHRHGAAASLISNRPE